MEGAVVMGWLINLCNYFVSFDQVGVVHMSDNSKMYVIPTSDLSQRLGRLHVVISPGMVGRSHKRMKGPALRRRS